MVDIQLVYVLIEKYHYFNDLFAGYKNLRRVSSIEELEEIRGDMPSVIYKRAHHVITEIKRVEAGAKALNNNDYETFGRLMYESHESLRNDFEVSCEELDQLVDLTRSVDGVYGSRMTGAGFGKQIFQFDSLIVRNSFLHLGGCTVTLIKKSSVKKCINTIQQGYDGAASFYEFEPTRGAYSIDLKQGY